MKRIFFAFLAICFLFSCLAVQPMSVQAADAPASRAADGWVFQNGNWYYYQNGEPVCNSWLQIGGYWYYMTPGGIMATNQWVMYDQSWLYVGPDGRIVTNAWIKDGQSWLYLDQNGHIATNLWIVDDYGWRYVDQTGHPLTNTWKQDSVGWCYLGADGYMIANQWIMINNNWYYFKNGYMVSNTWVDGYWIGADGIAERITIIYDANGGENAPAQQEKTSGQALALSSQTPTREHYVFLGWSLSPSGEVDYRPGDVYTANTCATLYAVWGSLEGVHWDMDKTSGTLTIYGTGSMSNHYYDAMSIPWRFWTFDIKHVVIEQGITGLCANMFYGCTNLKDVTIAESVRSIGVYAFYNCYSLENVYYAGTAAQWESIDVAPGNMALKCNIHYNHIHDYSETQRLEPACNHDGYIQYTCSHGESYTVILPALEHDYSVELKDIPASCTAPGLVGRKACSSCGAEIGGVPVAPLGHTVNSGTCGCCGLNIVKSGTNGIHWALDSTGTLTLYGNGSMYTGYYDNMSMPWYLWKSNIHRVVVEEGVTSLCNNMFYGCTNLKDVTIAGSVSMIGAYTFYNCNDLENVYYAGSSAQWAHLSIGPGNGILSDAALHYNHIHSYSQPVRVEPTCTQDGYIEYTCTYGDSYRVTLSALGHNYSGPVKTIAPTCEAEGYSGRSCTRCDAFRHDTILKPLGHRVVEIPAVLPTCTENGATAGSGCDRCGTILVHPVPVEALGHSFTRYISDGNATCTANGTQTAKCDRCSVTDTRTEENSALGHSYGQWYVVVAATMFQEGTEHRNCVRCSDYESRSIEKLPLNGWIEENSNWFFYIDGTKLCNTWKQDSKGWCYLGADGAMATNQWIQDAQGWCYVGDDGYCVTNTWKQDSVGWCYLDAEGRMAVNTWIQDSAGWCYVGSNGYCITDTWVQDSAGWVYLNAEGRMATNCWVQDSAGWCYVGEDGYAVTNCWKLDSAGWCYLGSNGSMVKNQWLCYNGDWYYLNANGYMVTSTWVDGYWIGADGIWR